MGSLTVTFPDPAFCLLTALCNLSSISFAVSLADPQSAVAQLKSEVFNLTLRILQNGPQH